MHVLRVHIAPRAVAVQQPVVLVNILVPWPAHVPASVPVAMAPVHHHPVQTPVRPVRIQRAVHPAVRQSVRVVMVGPGQHHRAQINVRPVHIVHQPVVLHNHRVPVSVRVAMVQRGQLHPVRHHVRRVHIQRVVHHHALIVRLGHTVLPPG